MGDYFINTYLDIYYNKNSNYLYNKNSILLESKRAYYNYPIDDKMSLNNYYKKCLEPSIKPIIIYQNNNFTEPLFETNYKKIIDETIKNEYNNIIKIVKNERRYERT
jgi:hypothetical protein